MTFTPKTWKNGPSGGTPLSAAALIDLEERVTAYEAFPKGVAGEAGKLLAADDSSLAGLISDKVKVVNVVSKGITGGDTDWSTQLQTLMNELSTGGGGILRFPNSGTKSYYRFQHLEMRSNVFISQDPGVDFRLPKTGLLEHPEVLTAGGGTDYTSATYNVINIGAIGRLRIDISEAGETANTKAVAFYAVKGAFFPWIDVVVGEAHNGAVYFAPNNAWKGKTVEVTNLLPANIKIGLITQNGTAVNGSGAIEVAGARDCHIETVIGTGGIAGRFETFATPGGVAYGLIDGFRLDYVKNTEGQSAFSVSTHEQTIKGVHIGTAVSRGCASWGTVSCASGSSLGGISIDYGDCDGTGAKETQESGFTEGLFVVNGSFAFFKSQFHIGALVVRNITGSGIWAMPGLHIGALEIETCGQFGCKEASSAGTTASTRVRIDKLKIVNPNGGEPSNPSGVLTQYIERWDIGTFEAIDNRGIGAKMGYGARAGSESTINLGNALITGYVTARTSTVSSGAIIEANAIGAAPIIRGPIYDDYLRWGSKAVRSAFPRYVPTASTATTNGTIFASAVPMYKGDIAKNVQFFTRATHALGTGPHLWLALYNSALELLAYSVDDTENVFSTTGIKKQLTKNAAGETITSFTITADGIYYAAEMVYVGSSGGTFPNMDAAAASNAGSILGEPIEGAKKLAIQTATGGSTATPPAKLEGTTTSNGFILRAHVSPV